MAVPIKTLLPEPGIDQSNPGAQYPYREFCNSQPCVCHFHSAHSARHCLVQYVQVGPAAHPPTKAVFSTCAVGVRGISTASGLPTTDRAFHTLEFAA